MKFTRSTVSSRDQPFATAVLDPVRYAVLVKYLERRGSIAWLAQELQRELRK